MERPSEPVTIVRCTVNGKSIETIDTGTSSYIMSHIPSADVSQCMTGNQVF
jgi:hypothetical protein